MEKMLEALIDELATRVAAKLVENQGDMLAFLKVGPKVQLEQIEGLDDHITEIARNVFDDKIEHVSVSVDAELRT